MYKVLIVSGIAGLLVQATAASAQQASAAQREAIERANHALDALQANGDYGNFAKFDNRDKGVKGSPFIYPGWQRADFRLFAGTELCNVPTKYDVYHHEIRVLRLQGDSVIIDAYKVQRFTLHAMTSSGPVDHVFQRFINLADTRLAAEYFEVLGEKDGVQFLKLHRKVLQKGNTETTYGGAATGGWFENKAEYYTLVNGATSLSPFKLSAKALASVKPEWKPVVEQFGKPIRNEADLLAFVRYATSK